MITGYNTDVKHGSLVFHVQTEDKGLSNPCIESLIYVGGQILARKRAGYRGLLEGGHSKDSIVELMERQHRLMIAEIKTGKLDEQIAAVTGDAAAAPQPPPEEPPAAKTPERDSTEVLPPSGPPPMDLDSRQDAGPSLDQVILDYLNSEAEQEHLVLVMESGDELRLGRDAVLNVNAKSSLGGEPVGGSEVVVRLISTTTEPRVLGQGETNAEGHATIRVSIPDLRSGSAALIVAATSSVGSAEIKHLI